MSLPPTTRGNWLAPPPPGYYAAAPAPPLYAAGPLSGAVAPAPSYYLAAPAPNFYAAGPPSGYYMVGPPPGYYAAGPPPGYYATGPPPDYYPAAPAPGYYSAAIAPGYHQASPPLAEGRHLPREGREGCYTTPKGRYPTPTRPLPPQRPYMPRPRPQAASPPELPVPTAHADELYEQFHSIPEDTIDNPQLKPLSRVLLDSPKWKDDGFLSQEYRKIIRNLIKRMTFLLGAEVYCKVGAADVMVIDGCKHKLLIMKSTPLGTYDDFRREFHGLMVGIFTIQDRGEHPELRDFLGYIRTMTREKFGWLKYHPLLHSPKQRSDFLCKGVKDLREHFWGSGLSRQDLTRDCRRVWGSQSTWPANIGGVENPIDEMFRREANKSQYSRRDTEASVRLGRNMLEHLDQMVMGSVPGAVQSVRDEVVRYLYSYFPGLWISLYKYLIDYNIDVTFRSELYGKKLPVLARQTS